MSSNPRSMDDEKDRLRSECDMLATQAGACAEEVDRIRVEIGAVQAENARLKSALADSERRAAIITSVTAGIIGVALTARRKNTHDWMAGLAEDINKAAAVVGSGDRFAYDGRDHIVQLPRSATPTQETTHDEG